MNYALEISPHNSQAHIDIEDEIKRKQDGLLTFILRVNDNRIVDCVIMEYIDARKYLTLKSITFTEITIEHSTAHNNREGSTGNSLRTDNLQHPTTQRNSTTPNTQHSEKP